MQEVWKDVVGYEGYYQVSDFGRIRSVERIVKRSNGRDLPLKSKIMNAKNDGNGYLVAKISKESHTRSIKIHKMVAIAFVEMVEGKPHVNHIDGVKSNNKAKNLEWCTPRENQMHAISMGLKKFKYGENHPTCKITEFEVSVIKYLHDKGLSSRDTAFIIGISKTQVLDILNKKSRDKGGRKYE